MNTWTSVLLPCEVRLAPNKLVEVSKSPLLHICADYTSGADGVLETRGLRLVSLAQIDTLQQAEGRGVGLGMSWGGTICFVMGVPVVFPRPLSILQQIDRRRRFRFRAYFYETAGLVPTRLLSLDKWTIVHQRIQELGELASGRVGLAIRWYGLGLGEQDATIKFLSYWIALEAIGDLLNNKFHTAGERAPCAVCKNVAGVKREGSKSGMTHMLALASGSAALFTELESARDKMFHGLRDLQEIASTISLHVDELQTAVIQGTLTVLTPADSTEHSTAFKPERTPPYTPQVIIEGTILDLTSDEMDEILYKSGFFVERVNEKRTNTDGGDIEITGDFRLGGVIPRERLADVRINHVAPAGIELTIPRH